MAQRRDVFNSPVVSKLTVVKGLQITITQNANILLLTAVSAILLLFVCHHLSGM